MEGHLKQEPNGKWLVQVYIGRDDFGKPKYRKKRFIKKGDALKWRNEICAQIVKGEHVDSTRMNVASYLQYWLENYAKTNVTGKTYERYDEIARTQLIPALGKIALAKLKPAQIQAYYTQALASGRCAPKKDGSRALSPRTVLNIHRMLRKALHDAVRWQMIPRNPCDATTPPRPPRTEMSTYNKSEIAQVLERLKGRSKYYIPILIAAYTGLRRGEILALRWEDIDLNQGYLSVNHSIEQTHQGLTIKEPKTSTSRRKVYMSPKLKQLLTEHKRELEDAGELRELVSCEADGSPMKPDAFTSTYRSILKNMKITGKRLHDWRHTQATIMLQAGEHPKIVQERLGHSTISTTMDIYSHVMPSMHQAAADKLDDLIG